ncbi:hypothetical protein DL89DRAFT_219464 [Linderina pennispora]|uniref:Terpenoid synthase n=1 Tax=Linderina pennispora TaxID=61395 RepID=A0A1Y1WJE7_9FUNG|nr:uncharacterized protein DL89DRAFT_219464 [Linderina pennispora]ORX73602.1 hypothetical protein DL89DRAFT_219464 [Linderina pennispora]
MSKTGLNCTRVLLSSLRPQPARAYTTSQHSPRASVSAGPVATKSDIEYCRQLVQRSDYDNYLVSLFSPRLAREAAWAIRALNIELVHIGQAATNPTAAQMRYAFWHGAINDIYKGQPAHMPVARAVHDAVHRFGISKTWIRRLVSEREKRLDNGGFEAIADVEKYGEKAFACLIHPHLEALGVRDMHADNAARAIGQATAIAGFARALPMSLRERRCDLPRELLAKHKVDLDDLFENPRPTVELQEAVFEFATKGYTRLCGVAELYTPNSPKEGFPALLTAVPVKDWLERLEKADFNVFDPRLQQRTLKLLWHLWQANRKGTWISQTNIKH